MLSPTADLTDDEIRKIIVLAKSCADAELAPLLALRVQSLVENRQTKILVTRIWEDVVLVGFGLVNLGGSVTPSCIVAVDPKYRLRGFGTKILQNITMGVAGREIRVWNHGDCQSGFGFAQRHGMTLFQELHLEETAHSPSENSINLETRSEYAIRVVDFLNLPTNWDRIVDESYRSPTVAVEIATRPWWPDCKVLIAERSNGQCVGLLVMRNVVYKGASSIEIHLLAVHPSMQGLGVGNSLVLASSVFAQEMSYQYSIAYLDRGNPAAMKAYLNAGFLTAGSDSVFRYSW